MMRTSKFLTWGAPLFGLFAAISAPASAQMVELAINDDEVWEHSLTELSLPTTLADFDRSAVKAIGDGELDMVGSYEDETTSSFATVYIYRPGLANVSIWHDRALMAIRQSPMTSSADPDAMETTFFSASAGSDDASAVRTVLPVKRGLSATGLLIAPYGDWFVKVRLSSKTLAPKALEAKLMEIYAGLGVGNGEYPHPPAYLMTECEEDLSRKKAKRVNPSGDDAMAMALMQALVGGIIEEELAEAEESGENLERVAPVNYCRDRRGEDIWTAYQPIADDNSYMIAIGDAGVAASVQSAGILALLDDNDASYQVVLLNKADYSNYAPFESIPNAKQAVDVVFNERPTSRTTRPSGENGDTDTTIHMPSEN